jgi:hypothetical protein
MNAANLPDGSIACVPSEGGGGGGIETIELTTTVGVSGNFTTEESAILSEAWNKGKPVIIKCPLDLGTVKLSTFSAVAMRGITAGGDLTMGLFAFSFGSYVIQLGTPLFGGVAEGTWGQSAQNV